VGGRQAVLLRRPATAKGRNLARDPRCVLATGDDAADLVVEGHAAKVGTDASFSPTRWTFEATP
jgi:hypothetical protein